MENIKYRAWYENSQTWVYFEFDKPMSLDAIKVHTQLCIEGKEFYQFTGLKDKNGKDIYKGDILMSVPFTGSYHPNKQIVDFYGMSFVFRGITKNASPHTDYTTGTITNENMKQDDAVEIIGNIHENPNLL